MRETAVKTVRHLPPVAALVTPLHFGEVLDMNLGAAMHILVARRRAPLMHLLLGLLLVHALVGCGGNSNAPSPTNVSPPQAPAAPQDARQGRYVGTVNVGGIDYYGDALITADGLIRLYIGGPYVSDGTVQESIPTNSGQLVGTMAPSTGDGGDLIFYQSCWAPENGIPICGAYLIAKHDMTVQSGSLNGEIVVAGSTTQTWPLEMTSWSNYYNLPATQGAIAGRYQEELAGFAQDGDTIVSIDADGNLSFQSAGSGCTGSGRVKPHLDGAVNVYDVSLTITGCLSPYDGLNSYFEGLATTSPSSAWADDVLLQMWLSEPISPDIWEAPPPGLTMSARLLAGS